MKKVKLWAKIGVHPKNIIYKMQGLKCLNCKDEICSFSRHNFVSCKCGQCFIDGGRDYTRGGGTKYEMVTHLWKTWQKILANKGIKLYRFSNKTISRMRKERMLSLAGLRIDASDFIYDLVKKPKNKFDKRLKSVKS